MSYLGRSIDKISNVETLDNITFDGSSSYSITKGSSAFVPNSSQSCLLSIDGVVQSGNFTVSGSTIDFGVAVSSSSTCNFFLHFGTGLVTTPSDGSVTRDKLNLVSDGSNPSLIAKGTSGVSEGYIQLNCAENSHGVKIKSPPHSAGQSYTLTLPQSITNDTFLKTDSSGNLSFASPNTPAFHVQDSAAQTVSDNTVTKVTYGGASIDTDSGWDTSNDRWTVPSGKAGKYVITALLNIYSTTALDAGSNYIRVNGATVQTGYMDVGGSHDYHLSITCSTIKDLSVGDYVEHWGLVNGEPSGTYKFYSDSNILRSFSLFRIGV